MFAIGNFFPVNIAIRRKRERERKRSAPRILDAISFVKFANIFLLLETYKRSSTLSLASDVNSKTTRLPRIGSDGEKTVPILAFTSMPQ